MKVGDLVRWENADGTFELGIITDKDGDEDLSTISVYFIEDGYVSCITKADLKVVV